MPRCLNALCKTPQLKQKLWILGSGKKKEKPGWSYDHQKLKIPKLGRKPPISSYIQLKCLKMMTYLMLPSDNQARLPQHTSIILPWPHTSDLVDVPLDLSSFHRCYITFILVAVSNCKYPTSNKLIPRNRANRDIVSTKYISICCLLYNETQACDWAWIRAQPRCQDSESLHFRMTADLRELHRQDQLLRTLICTNSKIWHSHTLTISTSLSPCLSSPFFWSCKCLNCPKLLG